MESAKTEPLECDPHPSVSVDAQAGEKEHHTMARAQSEIATIESDVYLTSAVGFRDPLVVGTKADGDFLPSTRTEHLELELNARASIAGGAEAVGNEHNSSVEESGERHPCVTASVSPVGLQAGENKHDDTTGVLAEGALQESNPEAIDVQAGGNERDDTIMTAAEIEASGCNSPATADVKVSVEECTGGSNEVLVASIKHLEQEVVTTTTQSPNTASNHEGHFSSASPAGETEEDGTFEHIPIQNQEELQGEEHVFDISDFDLGAHDVPITGTFFGEHCMFPTLDADKAENWQGSEEDVILMDSSCEHGSDQPRNMDVSPVRTSSHSNVNHEVDNEHAEGLASVVLKGTMVPTEDIKNMDAEETHLQLSFENAPMDVVHELNELSGINDSHEQGHTQVGGHQCDEADNEHVEGLAPVKVQGTVLTPEDIEDIEDPDAQETHRQGDAEGTFVSFTENNMEVVQPQIMSSEAKHNTSSSAEEVENEDGQPNADAAVHSVNFDHNRIENSIRLCVESDNTAANEEAPHLNTLGTSVGSMVETLTSHKEIITQAIGNEENERTDSQFNEKRACEQAVDIKKDAFLNERDSSNLLEAASTADNEELVCALAKSKEEEETPAVIQSCEIPMEAMVPVTEAVVQEERNTPNKTFTSETVMPNNNVLQVGLVVPQMEVDEVHIKEVEERADDLLKSVEVSDGNVVDSRQNDVEEAGKNGGEIVEDKIVRPKQENEEIIVQEELCLNSPVEAFDDSLKSVEELGSNVVDSRLSDVEEAGENGDEIDEDRVVGPEQDNEGINEQEELSPKPPADTHPVHGSTTEDVKPSEGSDGDMLDSRQSDGEETVEDRDDSVDIAGSNQERKEIDKQDEPCLQQPVDTRALQADIAEEATITAERAHTASSSDAETATSSYSDFTLVNDSSEGPNNGEERALQSLKPVGDDSKEKRNGASPARADSLSKKQQEKLIKHRKSHQSPMLKGGNKLDSNSVQAKEGDDDDDSDDGCASGPDEDPSDKKVHKASKEGNAFGIGDLVWAKVRSHPWWPAQIFDPADASKSARKAKKFGRVLVAFFGDCTFAWLQQSQMIAFRPNFKEKVKQTTLRIFCIAVEEALAEFCRRSELGLSCAHFKGSLHSTCSFPDANTGIREGVRVKRHKDFGSSIEMFRPEKTLEYVKDVACSPLGEWCSSLKFAEMRGHVYGLRTCMVASGSFDSAHPLSTIDTDLSHGSKLKRPYSSLEANDDADGGGSSKVVKKMKNQGASDKKDLTQFSKKPRKTSAGGQGSDGESKVVARKLEGVKEGNKDSRTIKFKVSKKIQRDGGISSAEGLPDIASDQGVESEKSSDDGKETLLALAGSSLKGRKRSSSKVAKNSSSLKKRVHKQAVRESQIQTNSAGPDSGAATSPRTDDTAEDAFAVTSSLSEEKVLKVKVKRGKGKRKVVSAAWSPASSIDAEDLQEGSHKAKRPTLLKVRSRNEMGKPKFSKFLKETEPKKESSGNDTEVGKKEVVRKFSRVGDSIRKVAGELTGSGIVKNSDDSPAKSSGGPTIKLKDSVLKLQTSPTPKKSATKKSMEDVSLLQLRQDLELLANETGGGSRKASKHGKKGDRGETMAGSTSPQWQNAPHKTQNSGVQELALAARKRKSEIAHDEVSAKLPKNSSTTGPQGHHASKAYTKGVEKPTEHRSFDKSSSYYSRRPALLASNEKGSSQRYDEKLSSHMPLGLFMRFPEDFPLPSESQLKAIFIPFGPLQMSATRLYHDSASAQVVFKHGRDAESAMRHAKKNALFGPVAVTYRLRHLSHSLKAEARADTPSPNPINSPTPVRRSSYSAKEKVGGLSAAVENKELGTSGVLTSGNDGSERIGDIQDQMMTLLRQVSVLVKPSPVGSDGT